MRARSVKRARQERLYLQLRAHWLQGFPQCGRVGCTRMATEIHHKRGRVGALLTDTRHWLALCHDDHVWVTDNPAEAKRLGLSESRLGAA